jgi:hypothetical protein
MQRFMRQYDLSLRIADVLHGMQRRNSGLQSGVVIKAGITRKSCIMTSTSRSCTEASILRLDEGRPVELVRVAQPGPTRGQHKICFCL